MSERKNMGKSIKKDDGEIIIPVSGAISEMPGGYSEFIKGIIFNDYMELIFEKICCQYMKRLAKQKKLPFIPHKMGKWWGMNSKLKRQDDCDILLLSRDKSKAIFCECKYKNSPLDKKEFDDISATADNFSGITEKYFYFFSKGGFTEWIREKAENEKNIFLVEPDDLFNV